MPQEPEIQSIQVGKPECSKIWAEPDVRESCREHLQFAEPMRRSHSLAILRLTAGASPQRAGGARMTSRAFGFVPR